MGCPTATELYSHKESIRFVPNVMLMDGSLIRKVIEQLKEVRTSTTRTDAKEEKGAMRVRRGAVM